jgi:hypothetical protein
MWFFLAIAGFGLLLYLGAKKGTRRAQDQIDEIHARMQGRRDDFERRHGKPAPF